MSELQHDMFSIDLDRSLHALDATAEQAKEVLGRFKAEVEFAGRLAAAHPAQQREWEAWVLRAVASVQSALGSGVAAVAAVEAGEKMLAPLGAVAKKYTIHCVGHAHIDMNWMWNWPETVATGE